MKGRVVAGILMAVVVLAPAQAAVLRSGTGQPDLSGWCPLPWHSMETTGVVALSGAGLELRAEPRPPPSAYELSLKLTRSRSLLFVLESPGPAGHAVFRLDSVELGRLRVPARGVWWVLVTDLPETGILRLELDRYVDSLLIRSVYYPCPPCPDDRCLQCGVIGALLGAASVLLLVWLMTR